MFLSPLCGRFTLLSLWPQHSLPRMFAAVYPGSGGKGPLLVDKGPAGGEHVTLKRRTDANWWGSLRAVSASVSRGPGAAGHEGCSARLNLVFSIWRTCYETVAVLGKGLVMKVERCLEISPGSLRNIRKWSPGRLREFCGSSGAW